MNVTPVTKRIGVVCITLINLACLVCVWGGKVTFMEYQGLMTPSLVGLCALLDGGK